jgi:hypothetical protein
VDEELRIIFAIDLALVTIFMARLSLFVRFHVLLTGEVTEAVIVGTFEAA